MFTWIFRSILVPTWFHFTLPNPPKSFKNPTPRAIKMLIDFCFDFFSILARFGDQVGAMLVVSLSELHLARLEGMGAVNEKKKTLHASYGQKCRTALSANPKLGSHKFVKSLAIWFPLGWWKISVQGKPASPPHVGLQRCNVASSL